MNGEKDNVCNMPQLLNITVHRSAETGKYYLEFIDHTDTTCCNRGYWTDREIDKRNVNALIQMCYPEWDGEHQIVGIPPDKKIMEVECIMCDKTECEYNFYSTVNR